MQENRKELYNLSNQMMDIFIKDIFSKNKIDLVEAKSHISKEQREELKNSVNKLKEQVESFLHEKNAKKTITEDDQGKSNSESPLREMFRKRNQKNESE